MKCFYFEQGQCTSCHHINEPMEKQLIEKSRTLERLFEHFNVKEWLPPIVSPELGFRNKAKMAVLGSAHQPVLGLLNPNGALVSLCDCPLYPDDMQQLLHRLELFVRQAGLPPYQVNKKKGELKFILLTRSQIRGEYMLRFVLRTTKTIPRIERELPALLTEYPKIKVISVNIQPIHMAILEGEEEIYLNNEQQPTKTRLEEKFNNIPLFIRPKSFFQTNPIVAEQLYKTAQQWTADLFINTQGTKLLWDLFCGVGGFGLHCAMSSVINASQQPIKLIGIEIEAEAITCAQMSAAIIGLTDVTFTALDSIGFASQNSIDQSDKPDLIIVNPPRRGIGEALCRSLIQFSPNAILYSSCNPHSLVKDLTAMSGYHIEKIQLFDLFPHTDHFEVLVLLLKDVL